MSISMKQTLKKALLGKSDSLRWSLYVQHKIGVTESQFRVKDQTYHFLSAPIWYSGSAISSDGRYEAPFMELMVDEVTSSPDACFFDIGGNVGADTLVVADCVQRCGGAASYHVFEPDPIPLYFLKKNLKNIDYRLTEKYVGNSDTENEITIDHYCEENRVVPTHIKIDIEGHEINCLKGMITTLGRHKPVLFIEFHEKAIIENLKFPPQEIDRFFEALVHAGYSLKFNGHHAGLRNSPDNTYDYQWLDSKPNSEHYAIFAKKK